MTRQVITGMVKNNRLDGVNSFYALNGDIEKDKDGDLVYISSHIDGERSVKVKELPVALQDYISKNTKTVTI